MTETIYFQNGEITTVDIKDQYIYKLDHHINSDGCIDYMDKTIRLNLKRTEQSAKRERRVFQKELVATISHEEIHRCIIGIVSREASKKFDNYCLKFNKTAKKYLMW